MFLKTCETVNDTIMLCPTPDLRQTFPHRNLSSVTTSPLASLHYGFAMDNVDSLLYFSTKHDTPHLLQIYPDPQFEQFIDGIKQIFQPRNDYLTINVSICRTPYICSLVATAFCCSSCRLMLSLLFVFVLQTVFR